MLSVWRAEGAEFLFFFKREKVEEGEPKILKIGADEHNKTGPGERKQRKRIKQKGCK